MLQSYGTTVRRGGGGGDRATAVYTNAAFCYGEDALSDISADGADPDGIPFGFLLCSSSNLSEDLLRAVVPSDVEAVLNIVWEPPEEERKDSSLHNTLFRQGKAASAAKAALNPWSTRKGCRDSAVELEAQDIFLDDHLSTQESAESLDLAPDPSYSDVESQDFSSSMRSSTALLIDSRFDFVSEDTSARPEIVTSEWGVGGVYITYSTTTRNRALQARIDATRMGSIRKLCRDVLLMNPETVIDCVVAVMIGKKSLLRHRSAAADLLSWFCVHPALSIRSNIRKRALEGAISAAMDRLEEVKHAGLRAIRNLMEGDQHEYPKAVSDIPEFPWLLTSRMDLESTIYLCQIFTILSDNATAFSEHSWLGRGMREAPKYLLGWLLEVLVDDRRSSKESREYILPCLVATLTRFISEELIEEFSAGGAEVLKDITTAITEAVDAQATYACYKSCVLLIAKIVEASESSAMKELVFQNLLTNGIVGSLFEILGSGMRLCQSRALEILLKLQDWDTVTVSFLIGTQEISHLCSTLSSRYTQHLISAANFIQKCWYQRMSTAGSNITHKLVKLVSHKDQAVQAAAVATLVKIASLESKEREISKVIVRDTSRLQKILTQKQWEGDHRKLVVGLLLHFLDSGVFQLEKPTVYLLNRSVHKLDPENELDQKLFVRLCKLFSKRLNVWDTELICVLFDTLGYVGHSYPGFIAAQIMKYVRNISKVWDLFDHIHLHLQLRAIQGFGRVLHHLRKAEVNMLYAKYGRTHEKKIG